jgi:hypothetical protein
VTYSNSFTVPTARYQLYDIYLQVLAIPSNAAKGITDAAEGAKTQVLHTVNVLFTINAMHYQPRFCMFTHVLIR